MENWNEYNESAKRSYRAAMSNGRGRQHEMLIEGACRYYKSKGRAYVVKEPEPFRVVRKDHARNMAKVQFISHAQPDFHGTLRGGQSIVFEAKYTDTARMRQDVISKAQAESMDYQCGLGALCFVCAGIQDKTFMVPWSVFSNMKECYGHKYASAEDLEEWRVKNDSVVKFLDYIHEPAAFALRAAERKEKHE